MTGDELRAKRNALGLSQRGLAQALGIERENNISDWERGLYKIPSYLELALAELARRLRKLKRKR